MGSDAKGLREGAGRGVQPESGRDVVAVRSRQREPVAGKSQRGGRRQRGWRSHGGRRHRQDRLVCLFLLCAAIVGGGLIGAIVPGTLAACQPLRRCRFPADARHRGDTRGSDHGKQ